MYCCFAGLGLYAQVAAKVIQFGKRDLTFGEIITTLQKREKLSVLYDENIPAQQKIRLTTAAVTLNDLLKQISAQTGLDAKIMNDNIYIHGTVKEKTNPLLEATGSVMDAASKEFLPGVSIVTSDGKALGITDSKGQWRVSVPQGTTLVFSFIGYEPARQAIRAAGEPFVISLSSDPRKLDQVVVTALGITQEKKSLGYAVQQIKGESLNEARDNNFVNSLSGKVAGVNIISSGAVGSSARITIRGEHSLNYGANQPLIVIDGMPASNTGSSTTEGADYGNAAGELNPADISSVNVLKGPAASALYGSRAANGVIVITTKNGKDRKGMGVNYTSGYTWDTPLRLPKFQNAFGRGDNGEYVGSNFGYSNNGLYPNGVNDGTDESWGPRFDGSLKNQFNSPTTNGFRGGDVYLPNRGDIIPTPWVAHPNSIRDFFETGHTRFNSLSLSGNNDVANYRFAYTNNEEKGIVPNNNLTRNFFSLNAGYKLSKQLLAETSVTYTTTKSSNRPALGYGRNTPMYFLLWMTRDVDINSLRDYWQPGMEGIQQFQHNYGEDHNNPFFYQYENTNGQEKSQLRGMAKLTYNIFDNLSVMVRGGTDQTNDFRPIRLAVSTVDARKGSYSESTGTARETNFDFLVNYKNQVGKIAYNISGGGNTMESMARGVYGNSGQLLIPGIYNLGNSGSTQSVSNSYSKSKLNSLYGFFQANYDSKVYLDVTGRNEWSSTLPMQHNSYFYPSVSTSVLINEIAHLPSAIDLLKLRLAYAEVGNGTAAYQINAYYNSQPLYNGTPSLVEEGGLKGGQTLKPERTGSVELGAELMLFQNRLGLDVTYYKSTSRDQIIGLQLPISSGYGSRLINAGEISNKGVEVVLSTIPVKLKNSFQWNLNVNFARNVSRVEKLAPGVDKLVQAAPGEDATIEARVGERMGTLYGPGFQRVGSGDLKGQIIIGSNGRPVITDNPILLGNINPDWTAGVMNRFSFKGVYIETLLDISYGGVIISRFLNKAMGDGQLAETAEARLSREKGHEYDADKPYFRDGAALMPDGTYQRNLQVFDDTYSKGVYGAGVRDFYKRYYDHNSEAQLLDRSYIKLRELKAGYSFPKRMFRRVPIQGLNLSVVARNLFLWTKNPHFDPETGASTPDGLVGGFENLSVPTTRSLGFNLNVNF